MPPNCGLGLRSSAGQYRGPRREEGVQILPENTRYPRQREMRGRKQALLASWWRQAAIALPRLSATLDFVRGANEQGERSRVFMFDDPIQKLASDWAPPQSC